MASSTKDAFKLWLLLRQEGKLVIGVISEQLISAKFPYSEPSIHDYRLLEEVLGCDNVIIYLDKLSHLLQNQ